MLLTEIYETIMLIMLCRIIGKFYFISKEFLHDSKCQNVRTNCLYLFRYNRQHKILDTCLSSLNNFKNERILTKPKSPRISDEKIKFKIDTL